SNTKNLWIKKGCIGWNHRNPCFITIDLGSVQPISGLIYSTAGGRAGVTWPTAIYIVTSSDGKTWHYAGDLVALSINTGHRPPKKGYANFGYMAHNLETYGRYVALGVVEKPGTFCDEIEIFRVDNKLLTKSPGKTVPSIKKLVARKRITN